MLENLLIRFQGSAVALASLPAIEIFGSIEQRPSPAIFMVITEVRPPFLADESCFLVKELSVHTRHFLHDLALPFPQWPVPTAFRKSYVTAILRHDVFCRESFNAAVEEGGESRFSESAPSCLLLNIFLENSCSFYILSFVLKHFDHILVANHKLAASVQHSGVRETAFHHDLSRCRIACKMVCPDVFEMLLSFKSDHFCKFHKIVIRPNIQLFGIPDKRQHVCLYLIHVCRGKSFI